MNVINFDIVATFMELSELKFDCKNADFGNYLLFINPSLITIIHMGVGGGVLTPPTPSLSAAGDIPTAESVWPPAEYVKWPTFDDFR